MQMFAGLLEERALFYGDNIIWLNKRKSDFKCLISAVDVSQHVGSNQLGAGGGFEGTSN